MPMRFSPISLACLGLTVPAAAQETPAQPSFAGTGWQVQCNNDGTALACAVVQQIARSDNGAVVAAVSVRNPDGGTPQLTVQLPLGIRVSAPVSLTVDSGTPATFALDTCLQTGCFIATAAPDTLIAAMQAGTGLTLAFESVDRQPITLGIPLAGFALAYEKL